VDIPDQIIGIDEVGRGCERPDSQILTENGWKYYWELVSSDRVLSLTNDKYIVWQKISKILEYDYDGEMIELKSLIHAVITPNHNFDVLVRKFVRPHGGKLELIGYDIKTKNVQHLKANDNIPRCGKWIGKDQKYFILPEIKRIKHDIVSHIGKKQILMQDWIAFLGIYLSEGCITNVRNGNYIIHIAQNRGRKYNKIGKMLSKLPFNFHATHNGFRCYNKQLFTYLKRFGKTYDKFVPKEIKTLSSYYLKILFKWLMIGDGSIYRKRPRKASMRYYTTSKQLRNDIQEIILKMGFCFSTKSRMRGGIIRGKMVKAKVPCYEISVCYSKMANVKSLKKQNIQYRDKVYCLELPKYHNFYVKRNGSGYFTGNSIAGPVVACAVMTKYSAIPLCCRDSKKFTEKHRKFVARICLPYVDKMAFGTVPPKIIDKLGIRSATKLAMTRAYEKLNPNRHVVYIDGVDGIGIKGEVVVPHGDDLIPWISLASIYAKIYRDSLMIRYSEMNQYKMYYLDKNKGYLTREHLKSIKKYGMSDIHRQSYNIENAWK